jgi:hypothetical protein
MRARVGYLPPLLPPMPVPLPLMVGLMVGWPWEPGMLVLLADNNAAGDAGVEPARPLGRRFSKPVRYRSANHPWNHRRESNPHNLLGRQEPQPFGHCGVCPHCARGGAGPLESLVQSEGVEPSLRAWQAHVPPPTPAMRVAAASPTAVPVTVVPPTGKEPTAGIEPALPPYQGGVLPLNQRGTGV